MRRHNAPNMTQLSCLLAMVALVIQLITATPTSDQLKEIERIYRQTIRSVLSSRITDSDIDSALREILSHSPSLQEDQDSECKPRPYFVTDDELHEKLLLESTRVREAVSPFATSQSCVRLHRCDEHSGCCSGGSKCSVIAQEIIKAQIDVHIFSTRTSFVEEVEFVNHTECGCQSPIEECFCPAPYTSVISKSQLSCECKCDSPECQSLVNGQQSLTWSPSALWSHLPLTYAYEVYKRCIEATEKRQHHLTGVYCPLPTCAEGLHFSFDNKLCQPKIISEILTIDSPESLTDAASESSEVTTQTTTSSTADTRAATALRSAVSERTLRRWKRKLKSLQDRGIEGAQQERSLVRKLQRALTQFKERVGTDYHQIHNLAIDPSDEILISCHAIPKQEYYTISLEDDYLLCGVNPL